MFGRFGRASFFAFGVGSSTGFGEIDDWDGATRYARPWRPVKPLLMIWLLSARSDRQRAHRRCEAWPVRYESAAGGLLGGLVAEILLSVLDSRLRNGSEGTRYVGNSAGGEGSDGKGMVEYDRSTMVSMSSLQQMYL